MRGFLDSRAGHTAQWLAGAALVVGIALAVGMLLPTSPGYAIIVALLVLALGVASVEPATLPLLTMPMLLWVGRIGSGELDLSVSDAVLFVATLGALVFAPRPFSQPVRTILWLSALYQFATLFTVIRNPYTANAVEWVHAWMLVSGGLLVGWTIGRSGKASTGLTLFLLAALGIAGVTITQGLIAYAGGDFSAVYPTWPFEMHKNFAGTVLAFAAVTAYTHPSWMGWTRKWALAAFWVFSIGILFTQSRQAIISLGVALVVVAFRSGQHRKRSRLIVLAVVPALALVATLVRDQVAEGNQFNSVFQRITWFEESIAFWSESPWLGHGLRFWYQEGGLDFQPPNAEIEVLTSAGVVGLVAFLILIGGTLAVLWRVDPVYGTLGVVAVLTRVVQGQLDLFWVAVQVPLPYAIAGICLGALALAREESALDSMAHELPVAAGAR